MNDFLSTLDQMFSHVAFDKSFVNKVKLFKISWISKTDDYVDFITSPLMGVYKVRFSNRDESEFFNSIFQIDKSEIDPVTNNGKFIPKNFKVACSSTNLVCLYSIHKIFNQPIPKEVKESIITELYTIIAFKMLGSIFSHFFPHGVDQDLAQSTYQNLSDKFLIKKEGSWERVLVHMSKLLYPGALHDSRIKEFRADDYIRIINDINTRLRSIVKNYASALHGIRNNPEDLKKIKSSTLLQDDKESEGQSIKDITIGANVSLEYVRMVIHSPNDFVDEAKMKLVSSVMGNIKIDKLRYILNYISLNNATPKTGEIDFVLVVIKQSRSYLQTKGIDKDINKKVLECLKILKRYYSASKVKIVDITKMKEYFSNVIRHAFVRSNVKGDKSLQVPPYVLGVILYIFLVSIG